jgi:hypothetical protein
MLSDLRNAIVGFDYKFTKASWNYCAGDVLFLGNV